MKNNFAIFILTHGRPHKQTTLDLLNKIEYTGKIYLVLDDLDETIPDYIVNYKDSVTDILIFDKRLYSTKTDTGNSNPILGCGVFARNAIEDFAQQLGLDAHIQADDDILNFRYRYVEDNSIKSQPITDNGDLLLDAYVTAVLEMNIAGMGFAYQVQYLKGAEFFNSPIDCLDFPYNFIVRNNKQKINWSMNFQDDYATQVLLRNKGIYTIQTPFVMIDNSDIGTGSVAGGMADSYAAQTELQKLMYIKMPCPNQIALRYDGIRFKSIKHRKNCSPKVLSMQYMK